MRVKRIWRAFDAIESEIDFRIPSRSGNAGVDFIDTLAELPFEIGAARDLLAVVGSS